MFSTLTGASTHNLHDSTPRILSFPRDSLRRRLASEQQAQIRRPNLVVGVQPERPEYVERALTGVLDRILVGLDLALDVLAEALDRVQRDGVPFEGEAFAALADGRSRLEAEP